MYGGLFGCDWYFLIFVKRDLIFFRFIMFDDILINYMYYMYVWKVSFKNNLSDL